MAQLDERLEDVERELLGVDDAAEVVHRGAPLLDIGHLDIVLPKKLVCFVLGHGSPLSDTALRSGERGKSRVLFRWLVLGAPVPGAGC